jgi:hypothetical protein
MWKVYEKAKSNILKASGNPKWQYYVKYYQNKYKVGDAVWLHTQFFDFLLSFRTRSYLIRQHFLLTSR